MAHKVTTGKHLTFWYNYVWQLYRAVCEICRLGCYCKSTLFICARRQLNGVVLTESRPLSSQEIPCNLRCWKIYFRGYNRPLLVPRLSNMNPVDPRWLRFILILSSHLHLGLPSDNFCLRFPHQTTFFFSFPSYKPSVHLFLSPYHIF